MNSVFADVHNGVQKAIRDFSGEWNEEHRATTVPLPPELIVQCFKWLEPGERVIGSHVCRAWRAIVLSAPTLWAEVAIPGWQQYPLLPTMLERSGSVPFSLTFHIPGRADYLLSTDLRTHWWRIRALDISTSTSRSLVTLQYLDIPSLQEFSLEFRSLNDEDSPAEIFHVPSRWATHMISLSLPRFVLSPMQGPFQLLQHFSGSLTPSTDMRHMFSLMPRLQSLGIRGISQSSLLPVGPLPRSLVEVNLQTDHDDVVDFSAHLASWIDTCGSRVLSMRVSNSATLAPFLELFARSHSLPWSISYASGAHSLHSFATEPKHAYYWFDTGLAHYHGHDLYDAPVASFARLASISTCACALAALLDSSLHLPALVAIDLDLTSGYANDQDHKALPASREHGCITAPKLAHVTLSSWDYIAQDAEICDWLVAELPSILRSNIRFDSPRLQRLTLHVLSASGIRASVTSVLSHLAVEYVVEDLEKSIAESSDDTMGYYSPSHPSSDCSGNSDDDLVRLLDAMQ